MVRLTLASITLGLAIPSVLAGQGTQADYERSRGMRGRYQGLVVGVPEQANWIDSTNRFWYRKSVNGGNQFVLVDAATLEKRPPFDHDRLAATLSTSLERPVTAVTLPFSTFDFVQNDRAIEFVSDSATWTCMLAEYRCTRSALRTTGFGRGRGGGRGGGGARGAGPGAQEPPEQPRPSPDRTLEALIQNYNVYVRTAGSREPATPLSWDGSEGNPYTLQSIVWSPDSKKLVANRVKPGYRRMVRYVESSPSDQVQPRTFERLYAKPGDLLDLPQPALFNVETRRQFVLDNTLFPNPYALQRFEWRDDSRAVTFEYTSGGIRSIACWRQTPRVARSGR